MKNLHFIAAADLAAFEVKCRRVHIVELGHLMFTAPTRAHGRIAERVATERLAANDLDEHPVDRAGMTALAPHYVPAPCRACGRPIVFVTAYSQANGSHKVPLDPAVPVYSRESDGEGRGVWLPCGKDVILARHVCLGRGN